MRDSNMRDCDPCLERDRGGYGHCGVLRWEGAQPPAESTSLTSLASLEPESCRPCGPASSLGLWAARLAGPPARDSLVRKGVVVRMDTKRPFVQRHGGTWLEFYTPLIMVVSPLTQLQPAPASVGLHRTSRVMVKSPMKFSQVFCS